MSSERDQAGPPSTVPTTTSVEPPPTSQTPTLDGSVQLAATAPANASRPSSSALSTRTGTPVAAASSRTRWLAFELWRPGAVTMTSTALAPSRRAVPA